MTSYRIKQYQTPNLHKHFNVEEDGKKLEAVHGTREGAEGEIIAIKTLQHLNNLINGLTEKKPR